MSLHVAETAVPGVLRLRGEPAEDSRGSFARLCCVASLAAVGITFAARQTSLARTPGRLTLRGLHYQADPSAETKIIHCLAGRVFDVALDLRPQSKGFGRAHAVELGAGDGLLIPPGCAHGLLTLSTDVVVLYQIDRDHDPAAARGIRWNDPAFDIPWPAPPSLLSPRDAAWPDYGTPGA
jgi:dTDP-4-dehydrorhamnose 3,5-epimerase